MEKIGNKIGGYDQSFKRPSPMEHSEKKLKIIGLKHFGFSDRTCIQEFDMRKKLLGSKNQNRHQRYKKKDYNSRYNRSPSRYIAEERSANLDHQSSGDSSHDFIDDRIKRKIGRAHV